MYRPHSLNVPVSDHGSNTQSFLKEKLDFDQTGLPQPERKQAETNAMIFTLAI